ncbi:MAG TPA: hypothetical protein VGE64_03160 [Xanthomonadaceae bacterium]
MPSVLISLSNKTSFQPLHAALKSAITLLGVSQTATDEASLLPDIDFDPADLSPPYD